MIRPGSRPRFQVVEVVGDGPTGGAGAGTGASNQLLPSGNRGAGDGGSEDLPGTVQALVTGGELGERYIRD